MAQECGEDVALTRMECQTIAGAAGLALYFWLVRDGRWRGGLFRRLIFHAFAQGLKAFPNSLSQLGQLLRPKNEQGDKEDQKQMHRGQ